LLAYSLWTTAEAAIIFNRPDTELRAYSTSMQNVSRLLVFGFCKVWHLFKIGHAVKGKCVNVVEITHALNPKVINAICFITSYTV
jgi:hypothetical protein